MRQPTVPAADAAAPQPYSVRARALRRRSGLVLGLLITLAACGDGQEETPASATPTSTVTSSAAATTTAPGTSTPTRRSPSTSAATTATTTRKPPPPPPKPTTKKPRANCVDRTVTAMSQAQRVGQLFMTAVSTSGMTPSEAAAITRGKTGSVFLKTHTSAGTGPVKTVADKARALASPVRGSTVGMLVATDQEGGRVQVLNGPGFSTIPTAVTQGRWSPTTLRNNATTWGKQLRAAGVNMNLAPVADTVPPDLVNINAPIGRLSREYGTNPATVATHSTAFLRGMHSAGVVATVKHFPGLGRVIGNTDLAANVNDTVTTRDDAFLEPFRSGIKAGVPFVMVSSATYTRIDPAHQAVFSSIVLRDVLRGSLGFKGPIISDDLGDAVAVAGRTPARRALDFFAAGGNLLLTVRPSDIAPMTTAVLDRLPHDAALGKNVDDSVRRVLTAKQDAGLLTCG